MNLVEEFGLVSPVYDIDPNRVSLAKRVEDFNGLRMGLLDNRKDNVDHLLTGFEKAFRKRFELGDVTRVTKFLFSMPASETDIATLTERSDFVIAAIAD